MQTIEFLYDFGSPNAYLVHQVLPDIAARHGADVLWCPVLLGGVFKATNNQAPMITFENVAGRNEYLRVELDRFVERHGVPFAWNPHFPVNTLAVMRGASFASGKSWERRYIDRVFKAMWVDGNDMSDMAVVMEVLLDAELPADDILTATQIPEVKGLLVDATTAAVARGVFGSPTMFLNEEMFFGKDALNDLEWRLS
ncbi:2-hydroxychromene-2-carboxylate isomerase [Tateyamaria pelophila]|uniref:2-hydroxychromene-2-carboxylate isomerase n=1 Tax=Tateyamaria pelophila TaxID=328415 RepID=UPI001CBE09AB|nr:2-hydroxychromene-2-carboxylate isomerase [Tateyamaria pelophila]